MTTFHYIFIPPPQKKKVPADMIACFHFCQKQLVLHLKVQISQKIVKKARTHFFFIKLSYFFVLSYVSQEFLTHVFHYQTCLNGKAQTFLYFCYSFLYFMFQYREYKHWQMKQLWCLCYDTELILDTKTLRGNGPFKSPW